MLIPIVDIFKAEQPGFGDISSGAYLGTAAGMCDYLVEPKGPQHCEGSLP